MAFLGGGVVLSEALQLRRDWRQNGGRVNQQPLAILIYPQVTH